MRRSRGGEGLCKYLEGKGAECGLWKSSKGELGLSQDEVRESMWSESGGSVNARGLSVLIIILRAWKDRREITQVTAAHGRKCVF